MALTVVKKEVVNNTRTLIPFSIGDWEMVISYEADKDGVIFTEVVCDGKHSSGAYFRAAKTPTNVNYNFNGIEEDFAVCELIKGELNEAIAKALPTIPAP
jgi:hypothetical protein